LICAGLSLIRNGPFLMRVSLPPMRNRQFLIRSGLSPMRNSSFLIWVGLPLIRNGQLLQNAAELRQGWDGPSDGALFEWTFSAMILLARINGRKELIHACGENRCRRGRAARGTLPLRTGVGPLRKCRRSVCGHFPWPANNREDPVEVRIQFAV